MLSQRLLMSALLIPATIGLFAWDHHLGPTAPVLFVIVTVIAARCVWELVTLVRITGLQPNLWITASSVVILLVAAWWPHLPINFYVQETFITTPSESGEFAFHQVFVLISVLLLTHAVLRYPQALSRQGAGNEVATLGIELFIVVYIGLMLATTSQLRWTGKSSTGYFALSALVIATKMGDVGAYTFGRLIGGPKMTPRLSPGKTWSGGIGHLVTAGLSAMLWLCWLGPRVSANWSAWNPGPAFVFGVLVGFAGLLGDLAESLIKRDVGVKDAPALLPGFGGLLDLMDSLLLAGPVAYGLWPLLSA
jgi:phosphatidate cytidylyltransferase